MTVPTTSGAHKAPVAAQTDAPAPGQSPGHGSSTAALAFSALGVVFGDIGTSPLYAVTECFKLDAEGKVDAHAVAVSIPTVYGVLSLFFWSLMVVISVKYLSFVMRADNRGEGGIFALLALIPQKMLDERSRKVRGVVALGVIFGAALLYGDGMITPAISVLSAVEGLKLGVEALGLDLPIQDAIVPITLAILIGLFMIQRHGTDRIGKLFGPVMALWFASIAALGVYWLIQHPAILKALNPFWAVRFFVEHKFHGFVLLGSVVLCITGGEALYADMGHFGRRPIRIAWISIVAPALLLNYLGQGAFLLERGYQENLFFQLAPGVLRLPLVLLATASAVIASQAMISGAFSITRQAVQMGYFPRVTVVHTSAINEGQIYIPEVNNALMVACLGLVLAFRHSTNLAAAYGIAVTGTMTITSIVYYFMITRNWGWAWWKALPLALLFLFFDLNFLGATLLKFFDGGWFPVAMAVCIFTLMTTWKRGRALLAERFKRTIVPLDNLLEDIKNHPPHRVRGSAVFMSGSTDGTPPVLLHHLKHNQVLHRQVVLLSIIAEDAPTVPKADQLEVQELEHGFFRLIARTGFMETPNVPQLLKSARTLGLVCEPSTTSYFLGRETLLTTGKSGMSRWRKYLFSLVSKNAIPATSYFGLEPGRVVELGMQVEL